MSYNPSVIANEMMKGFVANARPFESLVRVTGRTALVLGGTSGLGFCSALRLLQGGANVVVASFSEKEAAVALPLLAQAGFGEERVRFCKCDVTNEVDVKEAVRFTADQFGSLEIAVNSAGIWNYAHIYDMPESAFLRVIDVNLNGNFRFVKHVSRYMIDHGVSGKIVLISSDAYTMPYPLFGGYAHYAASKGGVVGMTTELARELKRFGITVNTVAPGPMATPGDMKPENRFVPSLTNEQKAELAAELANPQLDQNPDTDAVALAVYMMCTHLADSITGECILANSGLAHGCKVRQPAIAEYPPKTN